MQQQDPNAVMYSDAYGSYIPNTPAPPQFGLARMSDGWVPPPAIQQEESEEKKLKRDGEKFSRAKNRTIHDIVKIQCTKMCIQIEVEIINSAAECDRFIAKLRK